MATAAEINERIESGLYALRAEVVWLPNEVASWAEMSDGERASFSLDGDHLLCDYLSELEQFYRARAMAVIQHARYRRLLWKLKDALPLFERLGFVPIPVSLEP